MANRKLVANQKARARAAYLKKTRNSPAAKSGAFSEEERWQKHLASKKPKTKKPGFAESRGSQVKSRNQAKKTTNREKVGLLKKVGNFLKPKPISRTGKGHIRQRRS